MRIAGMDERPVLVVNEGELTGQRWTLGDEALVIGRGNDSDIVLPERQVSRHHLKILYHDGHYLLEDLDSKNGTFLNGQQIHGTVPLQDGDEIQIALCVRMLFVGSDVTVPLTFDLPRADAASLSLDEDRRTVIIKGRELDPPLSLAQFRLLEMLYDANGAVCGRDDIIEAVWPGTSGLGVSEQAIDALVRRLRDRLAELDDHNYIVTVRGHGFRLDRA
jgi:predicted component of type VI protein secretion system